MQALRAENTEFFTQQADEIEPAIRNLESEDPELRKQSAEYVMGRCHVRDLGDMFVRELTAAEWWGLLYELDRYARHCAQNPEKRGA